MAPFAAWTQCACPGATPRFTVDAPETIKAQGRNLGIDYDDTVSADPELFRAIAELALLRGWDVYVVTARHSGCRIPSPWHELAIYCGGRPKREVCEARGVHIDVWIDDTPESITQVDPQHAGPG